MARAGQQVLRETGRLEDRISVGVPARAFPRQAVEEAIDAAGAREQRNRMLPAWLTVYFVLALALPSRTVAGRLMRRLAGTLARAGAGDHGAHPVGGGAVQCPLAAGGRAAAAAVREDRGAGGGSGHAGRVLARAAPGGAGRDHPGSAAGPSTTSR